MLPTLSTIKLLLSMYLLVGQLDFTNIVIVVGEVLAVLLLMIASWEMLLIMESRLIIMYPHLKFLILQTAA